MDNSVDANRQRNATPADAAAIAELWTDVFVRSGQVPRSEPFAPEEAERLIAAGAGRVALGEAGEIVGVVLLLPHPVAGLLTESGDESVLFRLAVSEAARGNGAGGALVDWCIETARARGDRRIFLWTRPNQKAGHAVYERRGFVRAPDRDADAGGFDRLVYLREI